MVRVKKTCIFPTMTSNLLLGQKHSWRMSCAGTKVNCSLLLLFKTLKIKTGYMSLPVVLKQHLNCKSGVEEKLRPFKAEKEIHTSQHKHAGQRGSNKRMRWK